MNYKNVYQSGLSDKQQIAGHPVNNELFIKTIWLFKSVGSLMVY